MKLSPPNNAPERILLYGDPGSGKSTAALSIVKYIDGVMRVVDTDYSASYHRSIGSGRYDDVADRIHVEVVGPDDWRGQLNAVRSAAEQCEPGDWLVLDSATPCWQALQTLYITMKHGDDFFDFFATGGRKDNEKADADMNWQVINAEFNKMFQALFTTKGHLLLTAESDAIGDRDDRRIKGLYATFGFKPKGQKTLGYTPHTVLFLGRKRTGEFTATTVKDRERGELKESVVSDFGRDYLLRVAGWRPARNETAEAET